MTASVAQAYAAENALPPPPTWRIDAKGKPEGIQVAGLDWATSSFLSKSSPALLSAARSPAAAAAAAASAAAPARPPDPPSPPSPPSPPPGEPMYRAASEPSPCSFCNAGCDVPVSSAHWQLNRPCTAPAYGPVPGPGPICTCAAGPQRIAADLAPLADAEEREASSHPGRVCCHAASVPSGGLTVPPARAGRRDVPPGPEREA